MKILFINGPNLNMLGIREPGIYGNSTYEDLLGIIRGHCNNAGVECDFYQSNHEGDLVDRIQQAYSDGTDAIVINPGAYTHTSIALLDALKAVALPAAEVHISDVDSREEFRKISYIRSACLFTVSGEGFHGYCKAADMLIEYVKGKKNDG